MYTLLDGFEDNISLGDKNLITAINKEPESFVNLSIVEFSKRINAANSTVSKFVRRLGFENYRDFQNYISKNFYVKEENHFYSSVKEETKDIITIKNYDFYAINETARKIDTKETLKFVKDILNSKKIWCIGMGNSYLAAKDLSTSLNGLGLVSFSTNDIFGQISRLKLLNKDDVLIFFSERFSQKEYFRLINMAEKLGTKIAIITAVNNFFVKTKVDHIINFFAFPRSNRPDLVKNTKIQQIFVNNFITSLVIKQQNEIMPNKIEVEW
ncbi:RpiR family transcriptional regulator [Williamsoniiplasma somnilux]|uniref:RpiR family transcriptional regulator n=1 Tax=Williamsoniiplasma somnilux TaxID=215578 RepID=A0A2K8NX77_9MOLU|nr:MurR/RpiR family transcriptional regulator [Williamsoniiplasma somnilux]ATZ18442.1 RpiR family transcriptional regulator [Williamsoniiplasma somnilux]